jgi:hypothetical protein
MEPSWKSCLFYRLKWAPVAIGLVPFLGAGPPVPQSSIPVNEATAIACLRRLADAQREVVAAVGIDTDDNGVGEFGYLAELAGTQPLRDSVAGTPASGV